MITVSPVTTALPDAPTSSLSSGSSGHSSGAMRSSPAEYMPRRRPDLGVDDVDAGAGAAEQPERLVDRVLDDRARVARARDAGAQLAQRALDVRALARSASCERASSSIRRAFAIARAAWSASARTRPTCGAAKASASAENVPSAPKTSSPTTIGATTSDLIPTSSHEPVGDLAVDERLVGLVVAGDDDPAVRDRAPEHADPDRQVLVPDPVVRADGPDPGVVGEPEAAGDRVQQVQDRAVRGEQPRGLLGGVAEQVVDAGALGGGDGRAVTLRVRRLRRLAGRGRRDGHGRSAYGTTVGTSLPVAPRGGVRHPSMTASSCDEVPGRRPAGRGEGERGVASTTPVCVAARGADPTVHGVTGTARRD